jgi:hypothetical protein
LTATPAKTAIAKIILANNLKTTIARALGTVRMIA